MFVIVVLKEIIVKDGCRVMSKRKRIRRKKQRSPLVKLLFIVAFTAAAFYVYREWKQVQAVPEHETPPVKTELPDNPQETLESNVLQPTDSTGFPEMAEAPVIDLTHLHSKNALLLELENGKVLAEKKSKERVYPASLTKMLTILLGIEKMENLDQKLVMKEEYFEGLYEMDASLAGFQIGEIVTYRDILYGAMLPSGAESCLAIAILLSGSEEAFVSEMNTKAAEIGMTDTHFANTTGLHDPQNYSTAADMALLLQTALNNKEFAQIFTTKKYTTSPTQLSPEGVPLQSALFKYMDRFPRLAPMIKGGKTGFTEEAGLCLASIAEIGGKEYILVTTGAPAEEADWEPLHIEDAAMVYLQLKK